MAGAYQALGRGGGATTKHCQDPGRCRVRRDVQQVIADATNEVTGKTEILRVLHGVDTHRAQGFAHDVHGFGLSAAGIAEGHKVQDEMSDVDALRVRPIAHDSCTQGTHEASSTAGLARAYSCWRSQHLATR